MRSPQQLLHSRARVRPRYALFPREGYPSSRLPDWPGTEARVLASPALGAAFVETLVTFATGQQGGFAADGRVETFLYVLSGGVTLTVDGAAAQPLGPGGYALVPPTASFRCTATHAGELLFLRKAYEPLAGVVAPGLLVGDVASVPAVPYLGDEGALLQTLIPDEMPYDLAMNIFTFAPGRSLPVVETHVMEHGLWFLQGKGLYYLDDTWMEVEQDDFIWMGPYVPQSFYATGPTPSKYLYYKNVNRDIPV
jgi:(S)-ureidoglycine aminohydrolase